MDVYINGYFEHSQEVSSETKKYKLKAEMLEDKVTKGNVEAGHIIDIVTKRAKDAEATLQMIMEENSWIISVQEAQAVRIKKLEALLKVAEQKMKEVESSAKSTIKAIALKAVEDFRASTKFLDEKVNFAFDAYGKRIRFAQNKVIVQYPELDLDFVDEFLGLKENEVMIDPSTQDALTVIP